jgi:hypothetical protein|tara:strand:+ start:1138 stop:1527 length:390 start_codon:yes stop_codon:yes gene_type:complete
MKIEVSNGEILDKLSILELKMRFIKNQSQKDNIIKEYKFLKTVSMDILDKDDDIFPFDLYEALSNINLRLWNIEDSIRLKEKNKEFDDEFVDLARAVYYTNDERSKIKKEINLQTGSEFLEEKSYKDYC